MCEQCIRLRRDLVDRVIAAEGTGRVPRDAQGDQIVVLTAAHPWSTSMNTVTQFDLDDARRPYR